MKVKVAVPLVGVIGVFAFAYFVPIYYVPPVPPSDCNFSCMSGGHGAYYVSISYRYFGQGAMEWVPNTYELINTPFGSFG